MLNCRDQLETTRVTVAMGEIPQNTLNMATVTRYVKIDCHHNVTFLYVFQFALSNKLKQGLKNVNQNDFCRFDS